VGADVAIICVDGVVPLSKALIFDRAAVSQITLTQRIQRVMNQSARLYKDNFGWQIIGYPRGTRAILNVPITEGTTQEQYVMNTLNGAWCRFTGMNANCWELLDDLLYFGGNDGIVYQADNSGTDYGSTLSANMMGAFNYYGTRGNQKRWTMCRPQLTTDQQVAPGLAFNVDFNTNAPLSVAATQSFQLALWDVALWDIGLWAGQVINQSNWTTVSGIGYCASIRLAVNVESPITEGGAVWGESLWGIGTWTYADGAEIVLRVNSFDLSLEDGSIV